MKWIAEGWVEPFKECVEYIPEHAEVKSIELEDWVPGEGMWENWEGRRTLIGDAAHTMTMCTFSPLNFPNSFWNIALTSPSYLSPRRSLQPLRSGHRLPPLPPPPCAQESPILWKHLTQRSHLSLRTRNDSAHRSRRAEEPQSLSRRARLQEYQRGESPGWEEGYGGREIGVEVQRLRFAERLGSCKGLRFDLV